MATRTPAQRREDVPAYVLHAWPYRETSLIVEAFCDDYGRIALVARGARRPRSELRGLLQAFQPLLLSWVGQGELKTLTRAEWRGGLPRPRGSALMCGFYLNELLLKLVAREDAHRELYAAYEAALAALAAGGEPPVLLRRFELSLLAALGYAPMLAREADTGAPVDPAADYDYAFDRGPRRTGPQPRGDGVVVRGATLLALAEGRYPDAQTAAQAKRLMREVLDHHLERRGVESRRVAQDLLALDEGAGVP